MMNPSSRPRKDLDGRSLNVEEIRLVADLRVMHTKVNELHSIIDYLKNRHEEADIVKYADYDLLTQDIRKSDEIYLWFVKVKDERDSVAAAAE